MKRIREETKVCFSNERNVLPTCWFHWMRSWRPWKSQAMEVAAGGYPFLPGFSMSDFWWSITWVGQGKYLNLKCTAEDKGIDSSVCKVLALQVSRPKFKSQNTWKTHVVCLKPQDPWRMYVVWCKPQDPWKMRGMWCKPQNS